MHRFFCPQLNFSDLPVAITDPRELHHLRNVLRLRQGDTIQVFNEKGEEATGTILTSAPQQVTLAVKSLRRHRLASPRIILACAIPQRSKFETIVEKATELGVDEIIPLKTARTQVRLKADQGESKIARYQKVAVNAAKQSQRLSVPIIYPVATFQYALQLLQQRSSTVIFIPSLIGERKNILAALRSISLPSQIAFFIGPEGDFTAPEYALAQSHGCIPVSLGGNVLKVETAALTVVICAQLHYDDARKSFS